MKSENLLTILKLNRMIDEFERSLANKRGEMNQETGWCDNTDNWYPTYTEPISYSIQLSYSDYWPRHKLSGLQFAIIVLR